MIKLILKNMGNKLNILGFAGSLRKGSYNRSLLRAAGQLLPKDTTLEVFDLSDIPPFNQDLEADMPTKVKEFKTKIRESDAILIATPEYNYSVPGVLKNAIDYASRPYGDNPFDDKPEVILTSASDKFDAEGSLLDENTKKFLTQLLQNLSNWTKRLRGEKSSST
jgi:chromate reductase, NAD(P)H dehydrogenase (quinone)